MFFWLIIEEFGISASVHWIWEKKLVKCDQAFHLLHNCLGVHLLHDCLGVGPKDFHICRRDLNKIMFTRSYDVGANFKVVSPYLRKHILFSWIKILFMVVCRCTGDSRALKLLWSMHVRPHLVNFINSSIGNTKRISISW